MTVPVIRSVALRREVTTGVWGKDGVGDAGGIGMALGIYLCRGPTARAGSSVVEWRARLRQPRAPE